MLRSTAVNIAALLILGLLGSATLAATMVASDYDAPLIAVQSDEPGSETAESTPEPDPALSEPGSETPEIPDQPEEPGTETGEASAGEGFGAARSEAARGFGACMQEHGGQGEGNAACADLKPGPAHAMDGHPGRGPEARPEHAGQGKPEHAGQGKPEHAGQGKPEHAGQGKPEHAGQGKPDRGASDDADEEPDEQD